MGYKKDELIYLARLAEQCERYDEMVKYAKQVATTEKKLQVEERNILSVAYKNVVGMKRNSRRLLTNAEEKESKSTKPEAEANIARMRTYREKIEKELIDPCMDVINLLDEVLIPNSNEDSESKVFYLKMKGDYFRYLCEFLKGDRKQEDSDRALAAYEEAQTVAGKDMKVTDPVRLGLALNFSVFYYEIRDEKVKACEMAKKSFNDAINEMEEPDQDENYKDSTLILQLLKDNISLWTQDLGD